MKIGDKIHYRGYFTVVNFEDSDPEDLHYFGHIEEIRDIFGFHGSTEEEFRRAFETAVDDYLGFKDEGRISENETES